LAAVLILVVAPADLLDIGFILSFATVLGMVLLFRPCSRPLERLFRPDPLRLQPEPRWQRLARGAWTHCRTLIAGSTAAWLVSAPLTAYYFQQFSLIALLGNLIAIPTASLIILTGCLSLVLGAAASVLGDLFNHANLALVAFLSWTMQRLAALPGGWFRVEPPPVWLMLAFFAALALGAMKFGVDNRSGEHL
jgi:competence protein ComEC